MDFLNGVTDVFVQGNYAYMAVQQRASLAVIDISNPADPVFVAEERGPVRLFLVLPTRLRLRQLRVPGEFHPRLPRCHRHQQPQRPRVCC